jgi:hypothetical protein
MTLRACAPRLCSALWAAAQPDAAAHVADSGGRWHPTWGDRCQELVWIGVHMDEAQLRGMLDACLLTDEEMALGPQGWAEAFDDPLPPWEVGEGEHDGDGGDEGAWDEAAAEGGGGAQA